MTPLAVLFMSVAVGFVVVLTAWCYYRVLTAANGKRPPRTDSTGER